MSKFYTPIAVDVQSILKQLPPCHHLDGIRWNHAESRVEIHWQHDDLRTPLDHAQVLPADQLPKANATVKQAQAAREQARQAAAQAAVVPPDQAQAVVDGAQPAVMTADAKSNAKGKRRAKVAA